MFKRQPTISVLRLTGPIGSGRFGRTIDMAGLGPLIERAFGARRLAAVALEINSPGGSPVQSALIAGRIRELADKKGVPVFAFCEDVAASGGYWLACAADEIFVNANSIVGSIGVISAGFGFDEAIEKLGVERRVQTAGAKKSRLDPFRPRNAEDEAWLAALHAKLHRAFIEYVKARRGAKLGETSEATLFSGEAFLGADAVELGLVDAIGSLRSVVEARFGEKVRVQRPTHRRSFVSRLMGAEHHGTVSLSGLNAADLAGGVLDELDNRAMWARYGY